MHHADSEIDILTALGFGPENLLSSEPKIFIDGRFLAALLVELEDELEREGAHRALFQIGLLYGFRDAFRILRDDWSSQTTAAPRTAEATLLAISMDSLQVDMQDGASVPGSWPEQYEAAARLSKLGPEECPACALSAGYTSGWLSGTFDLDLLAVETQCAACGDERCSFVAKEVRSWVEENDERALRLLPNAPFEVFRELCRNHAETPRPSHSFVAGFEPGAAHIWGPVMVLPFSNADEALQTAETLGREPETRSVRAVVIDLRGESLDPGFGAAALERVLEAVEAWGAEAILTGVSPLAEAAVSELEVRHLLLRKDLPEAVAAAFQIAEAQRHLL